MSLTAIIPTEAWRPVMPARCCNEGCRSAQHCTEVVKQFEVKRSARYAPRDGDTFCNIFAWDFTCAMGCEVPHWVDDSGAPSKVPRKSHEQSINAMMNWLRNQGIGRGWHEVDDVTAELEAGAGHPTLACWFNPHGHGHVAVVLPSSSGLMVAAAGARCVFDVPLAVSFEGVPTKAITFFSHL